MPSSPAPTLTPARRALHERSSSQTNILAAVRLVPYTPPRLPGQRDNDGDDIYSRTALPTLPSHFLPPTGSDSLFRGSATALEHDVSADLFPAKQQVAPGPSVPPTHQSHPNDFSRPSTGTSTKSKPLPKKRKHVALNPDNKTFRVLDADHADRNKVAVDEGPRSPSSTGSQSWQVGNSSDGAEGGAPRSPASCVPQRPSTTSLKTPDPLRTLPFVANRITNSPWNYQFVGGLRKVAKTPDLKQTAEARPKTPALPPLLKLNDPEQVPELSTKPSFQSALTTSTSTISGSSNYKVYRSSPTQFYQYDPPPSSSDSDDLLLVETRLEQNQLAPPSSSGTDYQHNEYPPSSSSDVEFPSENFQLHGDPSPSPSYAAISSHAGPAYSRESLVVPPLQPKAKRSTERFGYYKSHSRESLRTGSLTSISSVLTQEVAQAIARSNSLARLAPANPSSGSSVWVPVATLNPALSLMQAHPHQWSSQLSTVASESEAGTDRGSRSWSDSNRRRSSGLPSSYSRQVVSISSSPRPGDGHSRSSSLEPPQPAYSRSSPRLVEDRDEYGDGITDMQDLHLRPSRTRLSDFYNATSDGGRTSTMRSTASSRSNSLLSSSIPTWARLYYGSGERRYLGTAGSWTEGTESRPQSSLRSGSPDTSSFPSRIYSPRRRPRNANPNIGRPLSNAGGSMDISVLPELDRDGDFIPYNPFRRHLRPSSSILSPHLKRDRRASRSPRFFLESPSVDWSTEGNIFSSRRKRLIIMFISGFIFPFAWIIGAFLPLPPKPVFAVAESNHSTGNLEISKSMAREFGLSDEKRYESARWWRNLNRGMAIIGVLIITAVIVLIIVSLRQGWAQ